MLHWIDILVLRLALTRGWQARVPGGGWFKVKCYTNAHTEVATIKHVARLNSIKN